MRSTFRAASLAFFIPNKGPIPNSKEYTFSRFYVNISTQTSGKAFYFLHRYDTCKGHFLTHKHSWIKKKIIPNPSFIFATTLGIPYLQIKINIITLHIEVSSKTRLHLTYNTVQTYST